MRSNIKNKYQQAECIRAQRLVCLLLLEYVYYAQIVINEGVIVTFSEAVDKNTVTSSNIYLKDSAGNTVSYFRTSGTVEWDENIG